MGFCIDEPIDVSVVFRSGRLQPTSFMWHKRLYKVERTTGFYSDFKGRWKRYHYAVQTDTSDVYEIFLDTEKMSWRLSRIHQND